MTAINLTPVTLVDVQRVPSKQNQRMFAQFADEFNATVIPRLAAELAANVPELNKLVAGLHLAVALDAYNPATTYNFPNAVACADGYPRYCVGTEVSGDDPVVNANGNWVNPYQLQTAVMAAYALLDSPDFDGAPKCDTAPSGTNTRQIANTAFVQNVANGLVKQGGGIGQAGNKIEIGWSGSRLKATIDDTFDVGNLTSDSMLNTLFPGSVSNKIQKFSNGITLQWGTAVSSAVAFGATTVTFTTPFTTCFGVIPVVYGPNQPNVLRTYCWLNGLPSATSFSFGAQQAGDQIFWIALGYIAP